VLALDPPGFGRSSKPLKGYDFAFFDRVLDGFLEATGIEKVALATHDLGGPIALHWGCTDKSGYPPLPLNTLVYPEYAPSAIDFVRGLMSPERRKVMTCPEGLAESMRAGVADGSTPGHDVIAAVQAPFASEDARLALAAAGIGLRANVFGDRSAAADAEHPGTDSVRHRGSPAARHRRHRCPTARGPAPGSDHKIAGLWSFSAGERSGAGRCSARPVLRSRAVTQPT